MADDSDNLGDLVVNITGDFSELQDAIDEAVSVAGDGAEQIGDALSGITQASAEVATDTSASLGDISTAAETTGTALEATAEDADTLGSALDGVSTDAVSTGLQDIAGSAGDASEGITEVGASANEAEGGLAAMAEQLLAVGEAFVITEGLKDFVEESIEVYGATQNVVTSLELLGQSSQEAEENISGLADMSVDLAVPFGDLEQAARRLTVALQGVEGIDINDVLLTAANSAALTGKSFDAVSTALQRVEVTGAVTSRQLLQLGITWQQLAATAGTSVSAVQDLLKKGGQDATADLQLVMDTINQMAAGAAQAQAQTILGQITILENQVELLFESIGQVITPVMETIVGAVSEGVTVARDFLNAFQQLPAPIQNMAVAVGLAAAAIVPLSLAAAALGIALNGITMIGPAFTALMTAVGLSAAEDAAAEGAAAIATEAHGAAAALATGELEGLVLVEGESAVAAEGAASALGAGGAAGALGLVGVMALSAGMAIAVTVDNINTLRNQWTEAMASLRSQSILDAIQSGATLQALQDMGNSTAQIKAAFGTLGTGALTVMQSISQSTQAPIQALYDLGYSTEQVQTALKGIGTAAVSAWQAFDSGSTIDQMQQVGLNVDQITAALNKMGPAAKNNFGVTAAAATDASGALDIFKTGITVLGGGLQTFSANTLAIGQSVAKLQANVDAAQTSVTQLTTALRNNITVGTSGISTANQLASAQTALVDAQKALNTALGDTAKAATPAADSFEALAKSSNDAQTNLDAANTTWANMMTAFNNGATTVNGVAVNFNTVTTATNNLYAAFQKATGAILPWIQNEATVATATQGVINQFQSLENDVTKATAVLQNLQDQFAEDAKAGTLSATQIGELGIAYTNLQSKVAALQKAQDGDGATVQELTGQQGALQTVMVTSANGISTMTQATQAQIDAFKNQGNSVTVVKDVIGDMVITTNAATVGLGADTDALNKNATATSGATVQIIKNTGATNDNTTSKRNSKSASDDLAATQTKENQAWASGHIVIQQQNNDLIMYEGNANDAGGATQNLLNKVKQMADDMQSAGEVTNEEADNLLSLASAADKAAAAVNGLNSANSGGGGGDDGGDDDDDDGGGGGGGGGGGKASEAEVLAQDIGIAQSPGPESDVNQSQIDAMAQELADVTGQVVTTLDGTFIPAAQTLATQLQSLQSEANATGKSITVDLGGSIQTLTPQVSDNTAATSDNTAATSANTTATQANASATSSATSGVSQLASNVQETVDAAGDITLAITDATGATTDFTESAADAASGADDFTTASQPTVAALTALNDYLGKNSIITAANTSATDANTTATTAAQIALEALTPVVQNLGEGTAALGQGFSTATADSQELASAMQSATAAAQASAAANKSILGASFETTTMSGVTQTSGSGDATSQFAMVNGHLVPFDQLNTSPTASEAASGYVNPNPDLMEGYAPSTGTAPSGVNLTVNVTGNFAASDQSIQMLGRQVASAAVTQLRTVGGLKL